MSFVFCLLLLLGFHGYVRLSVHYLRFVSIRCTCFCSSLVFVIFQYLDVGLMLVSVPLVRCFSIVWKPKTSMLSSFMLSDGFLPM